MVNFILVERVMPEHDIKYNKIASERKSVLSLTSRYHFPMLNLIAKTSYL